MHLKGPAVVGFAAWLAAAGCGGRRDELADLPKPEPVTSPAATVEPPPAAAAEPFEPPSLAALDRDVKWIDRPVRDGLSILQEEQRGQEVACSAAEALALKNDSEAANVKILSALGRLPGPGSTGTSAPTSAARTRSSSARPSSSTSSG